KFSICNQEIAWFIKSADYYENSISKFFKNNKLGDIINKIDFANEKYNRFYTYHGLSACCVDDCCMCESGGAEYIFVNDNWNPIPNDLQTKIFVVTDNDEFNAYILDIMIYAFLNKLINKKYDINTKNEEDVNDNNDNKNVNDNDNKNVNDNDNDNDENDKNDKNDNDDNDNHENDDDHHENDDDDNDNHENDDDNDDNNDDNDD